jgi:hypothetical protein
MIEKETKIIIKEQTQIYGVLSITFGFIGIFIFSFIFSPIAFILGVLAISKKEYIAGVIGILFSIIGVLTSPILMALLHLPSITYIRHGVYL